MFHFVLPMFECSMFSGSLEWVVGGARRRLGGKKLARKTSPAVPGWSPDHLAICQSNGGFESASFCSNVSPQK